MGNLKVTDGVGFTRIPVGDWSASKIRVSAAFQPWKKGQPQAIVDQFGATGQKLTGSNVVESGNFKSIEFLQVVSK